MTGNRAQVRRPWLAALACAAWAVMAIASAHAQAPVTIVVRGDESPEQIGRLVDGAAASGRAVALTLEARAAETSATAPAPPPSLTDAFVAGTIGGMASMAALAPLPALVARAFAASRLGAIGTVLAPLALLALAVGVAILVRRLFGGVGGRPEAGAWARFLEASGGLARDAVALAVGWVAGRLSIDALFADPDLVRFTALAALRVGLLTGLYLLFGRYLLKPLTDGRPLMPLPRAALHLRLLTIYALFGQAVLFAIDLAREVADGQTAAAVFFTAGTAITIYKVWWFWFGRGDFERLVLATSDEPGAARRLAAVGVGWFLALTAILIWMVGRVAAVHPEGARWGGAAGLTQILVIVVPILATGVTRVVGDRLSRPAMREGGPFQRAAARVAARALGAVVWIGGLAILVRLWSAFLVDPDSAEAVNALAAVTMVVALAVGGWLLLVFIDALFDAYAPARAPSMPGEEEDAEELVASRLGTVLPLVRATLIGAILAVTVLVCLSRLGVDIGPLLAGFGILGLAISFGSQALVRDIVAGIFFIADDAFRVGEYIDTGRLKGTVEKITLRSVRLRHQSGVIHTIPFGQIQSVTNSSRDWATVKFNIRLERDVDLEVTRKTIKKVGQQMQEDPELGPELILPLKLQGVAEIADNALVCRLKFTAKPARASWVEREALKRSYAALRAVGIAFASNAVVVRDAGQGGLAGAAAAREPG
jgi:small-conductance mechanosensitive channel